MGKLKEIFRNQAHRNPSDERTLTFGDFENAIAEYEYEQSDILVKQLLALIEFFIQYHKNAFEVRSKIAIGTDIEKAFIFSMKLKQKADRRKRHVKLHKSFEKLLADFISHTEEPFILDKPITYLMEWSYERTKGKIL